MADSDEISFKMQVISVAFKLAIYEFWGLDSEQLRMLEGAVIWYSSFFFLENN
jgi:hypothetical protein